MKEFKTALQTWFINWTRRHWFLFCAILLALEFAIAYWVVSA